MQILALCGSLRARSLNMAILEAAKYAAPAGMEISIFRGIGGLPPFSPDLDYNLPEVAVAFRRQAAAADALIIACPEYAGGIPGMFKNALDWLVGSEEFDSRPVALLNVSPHAVEAEAALRLVLRTMSAPVVEAASRRIPIRNRESTAESLLADPEIRASLDGALGGLRPSLLSRTEQ